MPITIKFCCIASLNFCAMIDGIVENFIALIRNCGNRTFRLLREWLIWSNCKFWWIVFNILGILICVEAPFPSIHSIKERDSFISVKFDRNMKWISAKMSRVLCEAFLFPGKIENFLWKTIDLELALSAKLIIYRIRT